MSRVYRFHGPCDLPADMPSMLLRKRSPRLSPQLRPIGADAATFTDESGTRSLESYSCDDIGAVTLTRREADLIALANPGVRPPMALEDMHPWLPQCWFLNDSASSYLEARKIIRRFGHQFVTASAYCDQRWATICNSLRQRSVHDARFYSAWHLPIQEAHILKEDRLDRSVVAIDFNAMYPACMQQSFPHPAHLRLVQLDRDLVAGEDLVPGLYRCTLKDPTTDFIVRHNPFRAFQFGRYLGAKIDEPVEVDLNEFEIVFFQRHFGRIHLVEAVVSERVVSHPLAREVRRAFERRRNYKSQGNKALADREKYLTTLMSSCANRPSRHRRQFGNRGIALAEAKALYGIEISAEEPESATEIWMDGRKGVVLRDEGDAAVLQGPGLLDGSACHMLGQRIVARGRIALLEMMERILANASDAIICYANIDSIHFSVPTAHLAGIMDWLHSEASDAMGSFKIEAVAQHGLWLEPGRYWLYSDDMILKFRNRSIGDREQPFRDHVMHVASRQIGDLHIPIRATLRMDCTMSPSRSMDRVDGCGVRRQHLIEVGATTPFSHILDCLEENQRTAVPQRMKAFNELKIKMASGNAASMPEEQAMVM